MQVQIAFLTTTEHEALYPGKHQTVTPGIFFQISLDHFFQFKICQIILLNDKSNKALMFSNIESNICSSPCQHFLMQGYDADQNMCSSRSRIAVPSRTPASSTGHSPNSKSPARFSLPGEGFAPLLSFLFPALNFSDPICALSLSPPSCGCAPSSDPPPD